jgi:hypothetical protein
MADWRTERNKHPAAHFTYRVGPSTRSARFFASQKLTNELYRYETQEHQQSTFKQIRAPKPKGPYCSIDGKYGVCSASAVECNQLSHIAGKAKRQVDNRLVAQHQWCRAGERPPDSSSPTPHSVTNTTDCSLSRKHPPELSHPEDGGSLLLRNATFKTYTAQKLCYFT